MVQRMLLVAATVAVALTGVNCNSDTGSIFPMTIGSVWHTESYLLVGQTVASLDTFETGVTTTTALEKANLTTGTEVVRFKHESTVRLHTLDSTYTATAYSLMREEGDVILSFGTLDDTIGDTVMMTNPAVGQSWSQGPATAIVTDQEPVTVAAGTYKKAWKVKTIANIGGVTVQAFSWYARGVGNVKTHYEGEYQGYSQVYNEELTSATIK